MISSKASFKKTKTSVNEPQDTEESDAVRASQEDIMIGSPTITKSARKSTKTKYLNADYLSSSESDE